MTPPPAPALQTWELKKYACQGRRSVSFYTKTNQTRRTDMTDEEIIAVIQAHKEGKTIQYRRQCRGWRDCGDKPMWNFNDTKYRVKPETGYRPFKTAEEVYEAVKEHGLILKSKYFEHEYYTITAIGEVFIRTTEEDGVKFNEVFQDTEFADGTPFGVKN